MATFNSKIRQILAITKEEELLDQFSKFEEHLEQEIAPLVTLLSQDIRSVEVSTIQDHMTAVSPWRIRLVKYYALAKTYVSHCKSDHFLLPRVPGAAKITESDREAYQKRLSAGFIGLESWTEGIIDSLDSRINECKLLLRLDEDTAPGYGGRRSA